MACNYEVYIINSQNAAKHWAILKEFSSSNRLFKFCELWPKGNFDYKIFK